jgi:acetate kinase
LQAGNGHCNDRDGLLKFHPTLPARAPHVKDGGGRSWRISESILVREPILVINAGSSSTKFSVFETKPDRSLSPAAHGQVDGIGAHTGTSPRLEVADADGRPSSDEPVAGNDHDSAMAAIAHWLVAHVGSMSALAGVGHRVVHGGLDYAAPVLIDDAIMAALQALVPLAPLHQPHNIAAIRAVAAAAPDVPQVACFDTAFHRNQPPLAQEFALPREFTAKGVRRYGFHGLSYEYIASALPGIAPECAGGKVVVAHLGNGASMCAIAAGRSVATTMSFTAIDGLPMGTRTGALDPGVILYLLDHERMDSRAIGQLLYERSGLLGVSGESSDMRTLLASRRPEAREAVDLFVYRIGRELGSLMAALGGLDAIVFTAGIGEHAAEIRARVCADARWLGIAFDEAANAKGGPRISLPGSKVTAWVIPTNENLMVARHTRRLLDSKMELRKARRANP